MHEAMVVCMTGYKSVHGFDVIMLTSFVTDTRTDAHHFYVFQTFGVVGGQKWIKLHQNSRSRQTHANHARWIYLTTVLNKIGESEVYEKIFIVYGFPCEMYFSHHNCTCLRIPESLATRVGFRRRVVRNPSDMENHTKYIFSHTLHFNFIIKARILIRASHFYSMYM